MSEEQLKAFWEAIQADKGLQQRLKGITAPEGLVEIAKDAGFIVSLEDIKKAQTQVSDESLSGISGGEGTFECGECYFECFELCR